MPTPQDSGIERKWYLVDADNQVLGRLATRVATIPLLGMIAVIQLFVYPNAYNEHLVWGSILVLLLTRGPGVVSVDYLIERLLTRRQKLASIRLTREA